MGKGSSVTSEEGVTWLTKRSDAHHLSRTVACHWQVCLLTSASIQSCCSQILVTSGVHPPGTASTAAENCSKSLEGRNISYLDWVHLDVRPVPKSHSRGVHLVPQTPKIVGYPIVYSRSLSSSQIGHFSTVIQTRGNLSSWD